jgi:hypothetical protein
MNITINNATVASAVLIKQLVVLHQSLLLLMQLLVVTGQVVRSFAPDRNTAMQSILLQYQKLEQQLHYMECS